MTIQTQSWKNMRFADFVDTNPKSELKKNAEYPFIPMELIDGISKYPTSFFKKKFTSGGARFSNGDTVFARITPCLENGKIAQIKDLPEGVGFGSTEFFVFRSKEGISDENFIYYLSRTDQIRLPAIKSMVGASGRQRADKSVLENIKLLVPPITEQHIISDVLSVYDNLIENNARRIHLLEQMAQAIYTEWFVNFRFPDHEKVKMVNSGSGLGKIPEGWSVLKLRDCIKHYIGGGWGNDEQTESFPSPAFVIRGTDIPKIAVGNISSCPLRFHKESNIESRRAEALDIVFEVSGGSKGQPVGRHYLVTEDLLDQFKKDVIFASFCKLVRVNQEVVSPYQISLLFSDLYTKGSIMKYQIQSTGISNFKFEQFIDDIDIAIPSDVVQEKFTHVCSALFTEAAKIGSINSNLRQQRDLLLPKLVTGDIKI